MGLNKVVDFYTAKLLKEKGFDEECNSYYSQALFEGTNSDWEGVFPKYSIFKRSDYHYNSKPNFNDLWFECSAPTIAEVCMWLYEKHGIWVQSPFSHNDFKPFCWVITTTKRNLSEEEENRNCWLSGIDSEDIDGWDSPTEAYSEAILYTLKNLI